MCVCKREREHVDGGRRQAGEDGRMAMGRRSAASRIISKYYYPYFIAEKADFKK